MKNNAPEWVDFKKQLLEVFNILEAESHEYDFAQEPNRFDLTVDGCIVDPIFIRKENCLKIEYDFTLCNTKVKIISFYKYSDKNFRIDITMK